MNNKKASMNLAFIGLGQRGPYLVSMVVDAMPDVNVTALCDVYQDRRENVADMVASKRGVRPFVTDDYTQILTRSDVDCVIVSSSWHTHIPICLEAMNAGKPVASEVGGAYDPEQCWDLVRTYERTHTPVMLLENCCYGREEMTILNMVHKGLFGELVHAEGGYQHDLRDEVSLGHEIRHYRLDEYMHRNGEIYPTHELGPIAKWLDINRGNRMLTLTSMASKARGLNDWIHTHRGNDFENADFHFTQGDVVTTMIKCARGETIVLTHDTTLPRPYSRGGRLQGTKGIWSEDKHGVLIEGRTVSTCWAHNWDDLNKYYDEFEPDLWKEYRAAGVVPGHDGIDYLVFRGLIESLRDGLPLPIDVYDMAAWMVVTALSEQSIAMGSLPVPVPDFTKGAWIRRGRDTSSKYSL